MKWPGEEANLVTPQVHNPLRSQDDAMIGYVFQRGSDHHEFPPGTIPAVPGKLPARWTLGAEEMIQHQQHPNPEQQQQQQQMIFMNSDVAMMAQHQHQHQHPHPGLPLPPHIQPRPVVGECAVNLKCVMLCRMQLVYELSQLTDQGRPVAELVRRSMDFLGF